MTPPQNAKLCLSENINDEQEEVKYIIRNIHIPNSYTHTYVLYFFYTFIFYLFDWENMHKHQGGGWGLGKG